MLGNTIHVSVHNTTQTQHTIYTRLANLNDFESAHVDLCSHDPTLINAELSSLCLLYTSPSPRDA
eukprot:3158050-Lingulodinium_polyedra.AAC.1